MLRARDTVERGEALALLPNVGRANNSHLAADEESSSLDFRTGQIIIYSILFHLQHATPCDHLHPNLT